MRAVPSSPRARIAAAGSLVLAAGFLGVGHRGATPAASPPQAPRVSLDSPPPAPSASATSGDDRGPAGVVAGIPVTDATSGAVTWAETRALAGALLASVAWARRAVETEDPTILQRLYAAPDRDVAAEQLIAEARAGGGRLRYVEPPRVTQLVLLTVTPEQQARMAGSGIGSTSLAWAVTTQGPVILAVTWPGAPERLYTVVPADHQMTEVSVGAAVTDARLGVVWAERYSQDCTVLPDPVMCVV